MFGVRYGGGRYRQKLVPAQRSRPYLPILWTRGTATLRLSPLPPARCHLIWVTVERIYVEEKGLEEWG